ncbi:MAG TPA: sn-glycerol-3-phosphate ABC transporter ATP-binding protein UgpC [Candidatus Limnocylindria bacterium]|nr:sn-glycerol-3-phosphate ABC transporter ATP-binding protein UgpC [Candidatus Limnocylindria bacterium]
MATVTFDHLYKRYGEEVIAVNDLNLEVQDGEFLCLVGPSGCGKTTALRCVAGLEEISDGRLQIGDRVVNDVPPKDRDIAMVFQSYALYPHMSVYDNLAFGLKLRKIRKEEIDRRVKEGAKILGLERFLDRKPKALSGGQRQRVALGRAIVREPAVFLMDEPLSNLDAKLRVQTRAEIARLHQRLGTTTIYVTHDQVEAMTMGDRIAVMKDGILQQVGSPQELYDHPNNVFVAGFIGSPAMNFATVKATEGGDLMLGNAQLHLTGEPARAAEQQPRGKDLLIGFRPEHLQVANGAGDGAMRIPAKVDVVEYLGNEELIHAQAEGHEVVALISSDERVKVGDSVQFAVAMDKLHIFDPESEKTLVG